MTAHPLPEGITLDDLRTYVRKNNTVTREAKVRDKLKDKIKKAFTGRLEIGKPVVYEDVQIEFGKQDRFDAEKFAKRYPADKYPEYYTLSLDPEKVPETKKTAAFLTRSIVLHASLVEVADVVVQSDILNESGEVAA